MFSNPSSPLLNWPMAVGLCVPNDNPISWQSHAGVIFLCEAWSIFFSVCCVLTLSNSKKIVNSGSKVKLEDKWNERSEYSEDDCNSGEKSRWKLYSNLLLFVGIERQIGGPGSNSHLVCCVHSAKAASSRPDPSMGYITENWVF